MRKIAFISLAIALLVGAGFTIAWIGEMDGQLVMQTQVVSAQEDASSAATDEVPSVNQAITDSGQSAVKKAIAAVGPAVVRIDVTGTVEVANSLPEAFRDPFFERFFGTPDSEPQERTTRSVGSGFVIQYEDEKFVITNQHVISGALTIEATGNDGNTWSATVIGSDDILDIAILRLDGDTSSLPAVTLGDSDRVELGDWAIAIGSPLGLSYTVTMGIISATHRDIEKPSGIGNFNNLIQTDAAINPGNSGGPLVNATGEVIGINTMIANTSSSGVSIEGINFAIAINGVIDVLAQLIQNGEIQRGWLGVQHTEITAESAEAFGIDPELSGTLIVHVFPGDPADSAGIQEGDVVTQVADIPIASSDDLNREVGLLVAGSAIDFVVIRDGESLTFTVIMGLRPSEAELLTYRGQTPESDSESFLGITVGPVTSIIAQHLGLNSTDGVVIMNVELGSMAEQVELVQGDVILEIDHVAITSVEEWNTVVSQLSGSDAVTLTIYRNGKLRFVIVE